MSWVIMKEVRQLIRSTDVTDVTEVRKKEQARKYSYFYLASLNLL
ncbi:hypothetical protein QT971_18135 [Microcoleus sp. herbarium19]